MTDLVAKVPLWALVYAGALVLFFVWTVTAMIRQALGGAVELATSRTLIEKVPHATPLERVHGRSPESIALLRENCAALPPRSAAWWRRIDEALERYETSDGPAGYFLLESPHQLLAPDEIVEHYYSSSRWHVIPTLLTSLGLLGTFAALLWGLKDLTADPRTNMVLGVPGLIQNLSGKFVTSVVALLLSVVFMSLDTFICQRRLTGAARAVLGTVDEVLPHLSPARIFLDSRRRSAASPAPHDPSIGTDVKAEALGELIRSGTGAFARMTSSFSSLESTMGTVAQLCANVVTLSDELAGVLRVTAGEMRTSQNSNGQLEILVQTLQSRAGEFDRNGAALAAAQENLHASLQRHDEAVSALGRQLEPLNGPPDDLRTGQNFRLVSSEEVRASLLPDWHSTTARILGSPQLGAEFAMYMLDLGPEGGTTQETLQHVENFFFVLTGSIEMDLNECGYRLKPGGFVYTRPGSRYRLTALGRTRVLWLKRAFHAFDTFIPHDVVGKEAEVADEPVAGVPGLLLKKLLPETVEFDMAIGVATLAPGAALPPSEMHATEHGFYVLEGECACSFGGRRLDAAAGDFIWTGPYCQQSFRVTGSTPLRYLHYQKVHRDVEV